MGESNIKSQVKVEAKLKKATIVASVAIILSIPCFSHAKVINKVAGKTI